MEWIERLTHDWFLIGLVVSILLFVGVWAFDLDKGNRGNPRQ